MTTVRGVTIHLPHDMIGIVILTSRYDTYLDTFNQTDRQKLRYFYGPNSLLLRVLFSQTEYGSCRKAKEDAYIDN